MQPYSFLLPGSPFYCIDLLAVKGKGTLSLADPTKHLVVSGLYRFSRNPMYVGVILVLMGEALFFNSGNLWIYSTYVFVLFNIFIVFREEPHLQNKFGEEYKQYRKTVRRWL